MNRTIRAILAVVFLAVIVFSAISITQNAFKQVRFDVTDHKLYTLSDGTKAILARLNQPVKMKLYYTKTAAMKAPDQIRFFNNYYYFVESLLAEYAAQSKGMVELEVIDPRPFTDDEADALRYGLTRIPMAEEESFIFGLVVQTQFGVTKSIELFSPNRQSFVEYDISYMIDTAIRRQKQRVGVLSSLPVMGTVSGYMAQMMRMQGQEPPGPWTIIEQLQMKYDVKKIEADVEEINDVDVLLVIHPKDLPEKTLFAIDQFVVGGGRTVVFVDPHCLADQPPRGTNMMSTGHKSSSNLKKLMRQWQLKMPKNTFAGDRVLALATPLGQMQRPKKVIGLLGITPSGFNPDSVITAQLNNVTILFAGALKVIEPFDANETKLTHTPLVSTTSRGNTWTVSSPFELMMPDPDRFMEKFVDGTSQVRMGYMVTGQFASAFPDGIVVKDESDPNSEPRKLTGAQYADADCAVVVFSDVDFITDNVAYQAIPFIGKTPRGDNATLLLNAIDDLGGSADLISIRSRGSFTRPFTVVDDIEAQADKETAEEEKNINAEIASYTAERNRLLATVKEGQEEVIGSSILQNRREVELNIREAEKRLRDVRMQKREKKEKLGDALRNFNTLPGPALILLIAIVLGIFRSTRKRHYISHASDA
jgi:ABC-type uncharacterized transport system involved in gliding motility auxiliary subunit